MKVSVGRGAEVKWGEEDKRKRVLLLEKGLVIIQLERPKANPS